jgi:hypothetical protein
VPAQGRVTSDLVLTIVSSKPSFIAVSIPRITMANQQESSAYDSLNSHLNSITACLEKQSEALTSLVKAVNLLSSTISVNATRIGIQRTGRDEQPAKRFYRAWHHQSRGKPDQYGSIYSGNPDWVLDADEDVSLHFAEFHSDESNKKDTAMISATNDPIRAIKKAYQVWRGGDYKTPDATTVFVSVIYSSKYHIAREMIDKIVEAPLCHRLSREALQRLQDPMHIHLHDSEVFLRKIPKEDIKFQMTLQGLFHRKLLTLLPELDENDDRYGYIWPKRIRERISKSCDGHSEKIAERFKRIFCIIMQCDNRCTLEALKSAQLLMNDDLLIRPEVREDGFRILLEAQDALTRRPRRIVCPIRGKKKIGFSDDDDQLKSEST